MRGVARQAVRALLNTGEMGHHTSERGVMDLLTLHTLLNQTLRPGQQPLPADLTRLNTASKWRKSGCVPTARSIRRNGFVCRHVAVQVKARQDAV